MAKYTVRPGSGGIGFDITVIGGKCARNTLLGFSTEIEAQAGPLQLGGVLDFWM
jgi:hypothetical protein